MGNHGDDDPRRAPDPFGARIPRRSAGVEQRDIGASEQRPPSRHSTRAARPSRTKSASSKSNYWDRPKPVRDWHWFLGRLGSTLIVTGLLVFLFVGYQLWGTGIEAAQSQERLENSFIDLTSAVPDVSGQANESEQPPAPIELGNGDPMALIEIPAIGVTKYVVAGVETSDLKKGPGHYPNTPFPGELGNAAIAGHRTTYGEPFRQLDELVVGDSIVLTDLVGRRFTYLVTGQQIVTPQDSWVVDTVDPTIATLTLTTCHPEFSAKQRLIVFAELDPLQSDGVAYPAAAYRGTSNSASGAPASSTMPDANTVVTEPDAVTSRPETSPVEDGQDVFDKGRDVFDKGQDVFDKGWFSDPSAVPHVIAWAILDVLVVLGAWQIAKRLRNRAIGLTIGFIPFFVVLYFVFQNVNRLLPPNL
ncbi:MAG: class E sortase [Actinomycetota bacterium]